jgi:hypothetical protein
MKAAHDWGTWVAGHNVIDRGKRGTRRFPFFILAATNESRPGLGDRGGGQSAFGGANATIFETALTALILAGARWRLEPTAADAITTIGVSMFVNARELNLICIQ